jgi:hypothetical protein
VPDLSQSVFIDGVYYCWDKEKKKVATLKAELKEFSELPENVIATLMEAGFLAARNGR